MNYIERMRTRPQATTVFVEDEMTKSYLSEIWYKDMSRLFLIPVGGKANVIHLADHFREHKIKCWGIVDLDYRWDNRSSTRNIIVLHKHEIENYLLDPQAIHACDFNLDNRTKQPRHSAQTIQETIDRYLHDKKWWFSACYILYLMDIELRRLTPQNPNQMEITDIQSIVSFIQNCGFISKLDAFVQKLDSDKLHDFVSHHVENINCIYDSNEQHDLFPGKQVFKHLKGFLPGSSYYRSDNMDLDFAKAIARAQTEQNTVPQDLMNIKDIILDNNPR